MFNPSLSILSLSFFIQLLTVIMSLHLIRITGHKLSWIFIATGIVTMGFRRFLSLVYLVSGSSDKFSDLSYDIIGLIGAVVMLTGVILIKPQFATMKSLVEIQADSLRQKDMLMKEVYHRVKNNLSVIISLLSMQIRNMTDTHHKSVLLDIQNRIKSMAMIHERLHRSDDLKYIGTREYIQALSDILFNNYRTGRSVTIQYDLHDCRLDSDIMISLGLILNELISNALKYAFVEGRVCEIIVAFNRLSESEYELSVRDNGPGLPEEFDIRKTSSLGLLIVSSLAKQLRGVLSISRNNGAEFKIRFSTMDGQTNSNA